MKKKFKMLNLDCANCAAKMEAGINKLDGVNQATISFMTQKMTVDFDEQRYDQVIKEIAAVCKKVEPDCQVQF